MLSSPGQGAGGEGSAKLSYGFRLSLTLLWFGGAALAAMTIIALQGLREFFHPIGWALAAASWSVIAVVLAVILRGNASSKGLMAVGSIWLAIALCAVAWLRWQHV